MGSLSIEVCKDGSAVTRISAELLRLPDGRPAAKWGGLAFPLHDGQRIDLADAGTVPALCRPWVDPATFWRFEGGGANVDGYVFFDGDDTDRVRVLQILVAAGADVVRSGPNLSGTTGDWFIRVADPGTGIVDLLNEALGPNATASSSSDASSIRERLLTEALEATEAARQSLSKKLAESSTLATASIAEAAASATERQNVVAMASRLAELEADARKFSERPITPRRQDPATNRLEHAFAVIAAATLPRIAFLAGSLAFIAVELSDRSAIWQLLAALDRQDRGQPTGWKRLGGHAGWWERHFPTGQDDQGRVYGKLSADRRGWEVLVSHKQDQASDLRRLS